MDSVYTQISISKLRASVDTHNLYATDSILIGLQLRKNITLDISVRIQHLSSILIAKFS